jgi:hypothetical protein
MTKITASTRVVQPAGIRSQPPRAAKRGHGRREATLLCNSILLRSPVASTLPENPVDGRWANPSRNFAEVATGLRGAPVDGVMWPTVEDRATPRQRPQSKQVPPWRSRSSASRCDTRICARQGRGAQMDDRHRKPRRRRSDQLHTVPHDERER